MSDDNRPLITRRRLLAGAGTLGIAALTPGGGAVIDAVAAPLAQARSSGAREALETLTSTEADLLELVVDRLIPSDANGPGAKEARVAHYIDRALGGALSASRQLYASGLEALDRYATSSRGKPFSQLTATEQDAVLADCEEGRATGFAGGSAPFFAALLAHTRQGMFGDPYYGGNARFVGWDLLRYPGVRVTVSNADQKQLESGALKPVRRSAYDYDHFTKADARAQGQGGTAHGD
jgi:gluconate 2-dehydrogenase gamma chain